MKKPEEIEAEDARTAYAVIGELVLISTALDHLLTKVMIHALDLGSSPMVEMVVTSLDPARKLEILKGRARLITALDWKAGLMKFVKNTESVFSQRSIACHTPAVLEAGIWILRPVSAAKLFKNLDLEKKTLRHVSLDDLKNAIRKAEAALSEGLNLVERFKLVNVEREQRKKPA